MSEQIASDGHPAQHPAAIRRQQSSLSNSAAAFQRPQISGSIPARTRCAAPVLAAPLAEQRRVPPLPAFEQLRWARVPSGETKRPWWLQACGKIDEENLNEGKGESVITFLHPQVRA